MLAFSTPPVPSQGALSLPVNYNSHFLVSGLTGMAMPVALEISQKYVHPHVLGANRGRNAPTPAAAPAPSGARRTLRQLCIITKPVKVPVSGKKINPCVTNDA